MFSIATASFIADTHSDPSRAANLVRAISATVSKTGTPTSQTGSPLSLSLSLARARALSPPHRGRTELPNPDKDVNLA
jgi:hypothetical protein